MTDPMLSSTHTERALLGAILLDNGAYHEAIASLQPGDLSLPAHRIIFAGITVPPNTHPDDIQRHISGAIGDAISQQAAKTSRNTMTQTAGGAFY